MNSLSWLIYSAELVNRLLSWAEVVTSLSCIALAASGFVYLMGKADGSDEILPFARKGMRWAAWFIALGALLSIGLPDRRTVLLIAASEIGERTLNSERIAVVGERLNKVIDPSIELLNTWITTQTEELRSHSQNKR